MPTLTLLVGNCASVTSTRAQAEAKFKAHAEHPAKVKALGECAKVRAANLAPNKQVWQFGGLDSPDSALVLVADRDVTVTDVRLVDGTPAGKNVRSRPILLATIDGQPVALGHAPRLNTGLNPAFLAAMQRQRGIKVGDFNIGRTRALARFTDARVHSAGLLHAVVPTDLESSAKPVDKKRLGGTDHNGLLLTLDVPTKPAPVTPAPKPQETTVAKPYLIEHPPARRQFKERGTTFSGVIVVHTAESAPDVTGTDLGAEGVAKFIRGRSDPGCYHYLADSDSLIQMVPLSLQTYGDGTGSNPHAVHISAATQAAKWPGLPKAWTERTVKNMALAAHKASDYCFELHGVRIPARRVTKSQSSNRVEGFISHGERDPGRRTDPGAAFPWDLFFAEYERLEGTLSPASTSKEAPVGNEVQQGRSLVEQALKKFDGAKVKGKPRPAVRVMAAAIRAALKVGPKK